MIQYPKPQPHKNKTMNAIMMPTVMVDRSSGGTHCTSNDSWRTWSPQVGAGVGVLVVGLDESAVPGVLVVGLDESEVTGELVVVTEDMRGLLDFNPAAPFFWGEWLRNLRAPAYSCQRLAP